LVASEEKAILVASSLIDGVWARLLALAPSEVIESRVEEITVKFFRKTLELLLRSRPGATVSVALLE